MRIVAEVCTAEGAHGPHQFPGLAPRGLGFGFAGHFRRQVKGFDGAGLRQQQRPQEGHCLFAELTHVQAVIADGGDQLQRARHIAIQGQRCQPATARVHAQAQRFLHLLVFR